MISLFCGVFVDVVVEDLVTLVKIYDSDADENVTSK